VDSHIPNTGSDRPFHAAYAHRSDGRDIGSHNRKIHSEQIFMRWNDGAEEMRFFSMEREAVYDSEKHREFKLYNIRTGNIFCIVEVYDGRHSIRVVDFFEPIRDMFYDLALRDLVADEPYSYDRWILPLFRNKKIEKLGI
jgi:hypothetical protein